MSPELPGFFVRYAWLIPVLPAARGVLAVARRAAPAKSLAHLPVVAGIALAFLVSLGDAGLGRPRREVTR